MDDYAKILINEKPNDLEKHIIYLTKYYEKKEISYPRISFHLIRWFQVHTLINPKHLYITTQFQNYLTELKMDKIQNFTIQDLLAMKTIPETMSKMDELLVYFKKEFDKEFGGYSKDSSRSTRLANSTYNNYVHLNYEGNVYYLLIGFFWWWDTIEVPHVGISLEIPKKNLEHSRLITILDEELHEKENWEFDDWGKLFLYSAYKPLTDFIVQEEDNFPAIKKYIETQLNVLYSLRKKYPKLFKK